jgi:2-C-methyl-D-erythritol 4-phosphate cytidylyltransferase
VIPAAGAGRRMQSSVPKQYLSLLGRAVLAHSIGRLAAHPAVCGITVALDAYDAYWDKLDLGLDVPLERVNGGEARCHSVLNALGALRKHADADDWVLVHDAARPCLRADDLRRLIDTLSDHPVGGLLAVPVHDTMKRADHGGQILDTVPRDGLWHAQTPQMFRLEALFKALRHAVDGGIAVTDEAMAIELTGARPLLVEGHADNIKITRPDDLALAEFYLQQQSRATTAEIRR